MCMLLMAWEIEFNNFLHSRFSGRAKTAFCGHGRVTTSGTQIQSRQSGAELGRHPDDVPDRVSVKSSLIAGARDVVARMGILASSGSF